MPEISRFYGIIIKMFLKDHLPPHFHAEYGEYRAMVSIETGKVLEGSLPKRGEKMVEEWAALHRDELFFDFEVLRKGASNWVTIDPLP